MDYFKVYEELYQHGYNGANKPVGGRFFYELNKKITYSKMLDIGCSRGQIVERAGKREGTTACGIDVAETAVNDAKNRGLDCVCASVMKIPFEDSAFDLVTCFDMLEHLVEEDVPKSLTEIGRVSSRYIALQVATTHSKNKQPHLIKTEGIHATLWPFEKWVDVIKLMIPSTEFMKYTRKNHVCLLLEKTV